MPVPMEAGPGGLGSNVRSSPDVFFPPRGGIDGRALAQAEPPIRDAYSAGPEAGLCRTVDSRRETPVRGRKNRQQIPKSLTAKSMDYETSRIDPSRKIGRSEDIAHGRPRGWFSLRSRKLVSNPAFVMRPAA